MTDGIKRRLTTVLSADVKSYTRLMELDEAGTLETLRRYREAMAAFVARHDGRIINTWGDAIIAEFASVVEAVQCAIEIQTDLKGRNRTLPDDQQMWFRIGINLGDVMAEGDDIYGEGVNIAARLQEAAEPGGILISGPVYDQVRHRLSVAFDRLEPQTFKNVSEPVTGYRVALDGRRSSATAPTANPAGRHGASRAAWSWAGIADWYAALPRPVAAGVAVIVFLFFINLFSGMFPIWFHWPALPILVVVLFLYLRGRGRR